jgi:hypothetical protein
VTDAQSWKLVDEEGRVLVLVPDASYGEPVPDTRCHPPRLLLSPQLLAELQRVALPSITQRHRTAAKGWKEPSGECSEEETDA